MVKTHFLALSVLKLFQMEELWRNIWEYTQAKNHFLGICVQRLSQMEELWRNTWEHTQVKGLFLAINVLRLSHKEYIWRHILENTQVKNHTFQSIWKKLQRENDLCDITLPCEDKQFKTRKIIISSYGCLQTYIVIDILKNY